MRMSKIIGVFPMFNTGGTAGNWACRKRGAASYSHRMGRGNGAVQCADGFSCREGTVVGDGSVLQLAGRNITGSIPIVHSLFTLSSPRTIPGRGHTASTASHRIVWSVSFLRRASAAALPARAVRQVATTASVRMGGCYFVSRKRTAAGVRPAMPMTRGLSPSNAPAT